MGAKVRAIKRRRKAVLAIQQITRAMELIAATRIVRAQAAAGKARPYARAIGEIIEMLASASDQAPLLADREVANAELVVVTSDRGLCGAYNSNVLREAERARARELSGGQGVKVTAVGKKGLSYYRFRGVPLASDFQGISDRPSYAHARRVAADITSRFVSGEVDRVLLAYTDFVSISLQRPRVVQILPAARDDEPAAEGPRPMFEFEPEPAELLEALLPRYVEVKVFAALLESAASEHAARRRAMKDATDNAADAVKLLKRQEDRARQAEITSELADLTGSARALGAG